MTLFQETAADIKLMLNQNGVSEHETVAIAVSGGSDSMALSLLAHSAMSVHALVVDHNFRENSADEAHWVCAQLKKRDIEHTLLTCVWSETPVGNIQAQGRIKRYELMSQWCEQNGVRFLLTGHHLEDQAETLLLRLSRGSGVYGLAGMPEMRLLSSAVTLLRPILKCPKELLRDCLREVGQTWVDDPSNSNEAFDRVKVRHFLKEPPLGGFSAQRLAETATRLRRTREALEHYEYEWLGNHMRPYDAAMCVEFDLTGLSAAPPDIVLRGLKTVIQKIGGADFGVRFEKLERLHVALLKCAAAEEVFAGQTIGGTQIIGVAAGKVLIVRELNAVQEKQAIGDGMVWDNRYTVHEDGENGSASMQIGALGLEGVKQLYSLDGDIIDDSVCQLPKLAMPTMPAIWDQDILISVPAFDLLLQDRVGLPKVRPKALLKKS